MAGDWIKMRHDLRDDPSCLTLSDILSDTLPATIGRLFLLWSWADRHTADGHLPNVTTTHIDRLVDAVGFADAMIRIGWLVEINDGVFLPQFERHNGTSAKARSLESEAKRLRRQERKPVSDKCRTVSDKTSDQRREEERREDKRLITSLGHSPEENDAVLVGVVTLWNGTKGVQPIRKLTPERRRRLIARLRDPTWPWEESIRRLPLPGDGWQPDFDWLLKNATNALSIVEGKFDFRHHELSQEAT